MAVRIGKEEFAVKVLASKQPAVVEFYSDSCIPCKRLSPILGNIEDKYEDAVGVYKVNVNFDAELAGEYAVMASPTILFFQDGKETGRLTGLVAQQEIEDMIPAKA